MITPRNYTIFGLHCDPERYSWAAYHLFVLLSCLVGDTLILCASFQRGALKLNKFIVTVIQFIAVCDLAYAIFTVLPGAVSLIANAWVLGSVMCYVRVYSSYFIYPAGMSLIAVLTTSKILLLKYHALYANFTKKVAHRVCSLVLIPPLSIPLLFLLLDRTDVSFDFRVYNCTYSFTAGIWKRMLGPIMTTLTLFLPNMAIVATTIPTLKYLAGARMSAKRVQGCVPWQGALTVAVTALVYCISTLPTFICFIGRFFTNGDIASLFHFHLYRIAYFTSMINIMSNFYIYALTMRTFRRFLLLKILKVAPDSRKTSSNMELQQVRIILS